MVNDAEVARIYRTGFLCLDDLNEIDRIRFHLLVSEFVLNFKDILDATDKGLFDRPTYEAWQSHVCSHMNMPAGSAGGRERDRLHSASAREIARGMLEVPRADAVTPALWSSGAAANIERFNPARATLNEVLDRAEGRPLPVSGSDPT